MKGVSMNKFWMVIRDTSPNICQKRHETYDSAKEEAERLCNKERARFYILEAVEVLQLKNIPIEAIKL